eukprot:scaffold106574_cov19-Tisochrysis_lutea.AAC.2
MFLPDWCPAQALLRNLRALKSLNGVSGIAVDIYWLVARLSLCLRTRKTTALFVLASTWHEWRSRQGQTAFWVFVVSSAFLLTRGSITLLPVVSPEPLSIGGTA